MSVPLVGRDANYPVPPVYRKRSAARNEPLAPLHCAGSALWTGIPYVAWLGASTRR